MQILQLFFVLSGIIIFLTALDIARKERFNALHFVVFFVIGGGLIISTFFPNILDYIGRIFGVDRGAYVLVYVSIIFLVYFSLLLLRKIEGNRIDTTELIRELALTEKDHIHHDEHEVTFVIAAYNEDRSIEDTVKNIFHAGYNSVIVVDDGSRDGTHKALKHLKEKYDGLTVLRHLRNRGQGAALETGFEYLRRHGVGDFVVTFDADGQMDLDDMPHFLKILKENSSIDIALGSRFLSKKPKNMPWIRRIVLKLGILFTYFVSRIHLSDTHNGYRVFRKRILPKMHITLGGMEHASEILDIIAENRFTYVEVPVTIHYTDYSLEKGQKSGNAFKVARRILWKKFFQ